MNTTIAKIERRLELLLLCDYNDGTASTIIEHIQGIKKFSRHTIRILSSRGEVPTELNLSRFDGLIIHYSLVCCMDAYIGPKTRKMVREFSGLKIAFVQDDYRFINQTVDALRDLGIHILFGLAPEDIIDKVYSPEKLPNVIRETVLAGYVPTSLTKLAVLPYAERKIDVGYRARKLTAWLGSLGQQKSIIADFFLEYAKNENWVCDISTSEYDRIYGDKWIKFIADSKAMIGSESGSSVCDFTGDIQEKVERHERNYPDTPFHVLQDLYFKDEDGSVPMNVISPRCFEAAALRTLMILYDGRYSNRLIPWRHYVPLRLDHSNMPEVVAVMRDPVRAQAIIDLAFKEVALNPENTFAAMVAKMDRAIDRKFCKHRCATLPYYNSASFEVVRRKARLKAQITRVLRSFLTFAASTSLLCIEQLPRPVRSMLRSLYHKLRHLINTHAVKGRF
jgi:hypothetical protein